MPHDRPVWRPLQPSDLDGVMAVAAVVHPRFPERRETFADKLMRAPDCCFGVDGADGRLAGYAIALPWTSGEIVPLDTVLAALPRLADVLYLHDVALLPVVRRRGLAGAVVALMAAAARRRGLAQLTLTAVYGADALWRRYRFRVVPVADRDHQLAVYGTDARYMIRELTEDLIRT